MDQEKPSSQAKPRLASSSQLVCIVNTEKRGKSPDNGESLGRTLSDLVPCDTEIIHYTEASAEKVAKLKPSVVLLTGQGTPWWEYTDTELEPIYSLLRGMSYPTLGICGGHQLMAKAFKARVAPIKRISDAPGYAGCWRERGYIPLKTVRADPLTKGLPDRPVFWQNHVEEVKTLPPGFLLLVHGENSTVQAMRHQKASLYGVQFHPERFTSEHEHGKHVLLNFLRMSR